MNNSNVKMGESPQRAQILDLDDENYTDYNYIYPSDGDPINYADDTEDTHERVSHDNMIKLTLITIIFCTAMVGNASMVYVANRVSKKTLCQKMLLSILGITCMIRASTNFIRDVYIVTFHNEWQFNIIICKADAFLDNFSTAAFPYVLIFMVFDSGKYLLSRMCRKACNCSKGSTPPSACAKLVMLVCIFVCLCSCCTAFAVVVTAITTTEAINSYGDDVTVNSTVCLLQNKSGTYLVLHSFIWLIAVPFSLMLIFYTCVAVMAIVNKCQCTPADEQHIITQYNKFRNAEEKATAEKNWLITVIVLVTIYIVCFFPYEILTLIYIYFNVPYSKAWVMIVFILFYTPPAIVPLVLCSLNIILRRGYYRHIFLLRTNRYSVISNKSVNKDDAISNGTQRSVSSTIYAKSEDSSTKVTCVPSISGACSENEYDHYEYGDENTHIIQTLRDSDTSNSTNCSPDETWSPDVSKRKRKVRDRARERKVVSSDVDEEDDNDNKPILVTSV